MLVDVGSKGLTGKECQAALDAAGITVNKNTIPFETRSPFQASGVRLGTPAVTTRGMERSPYCVLDRPYWSGSVKIVLAAGNVTSTIPCAAPVA